jgi:hypothetical protein
VDGARERLVAQLKEQGERRRAAQTAEREAVAAIGKLLPKALDAGISKREIARLTGLSRPWIDELLQRADGRT